MLWGVSALKCSVFQKFVFSRISLDRTCFLTDQNCDYKFGLNLPGTIDAGSVECNFRLIEPVFWSIENRFEGFLKSFFSYVPFTISKFFKSFSHSLRPVQIQSKFLCHFPSYFLKGFCLLAPVRLLYPSFFNFFSFFMHLREKF